MFVQEKSGCEIRLFRFFALFCAFLLSEATQKLSILSQKREKKLSNHNRKTIKISYFFAKIKFFGAQQNQFCENSTVKR